MERSDGRLTILIAARDASATIERAIASCLPEARCALLLADDGSRDDTVARARALAGGRLRVIRVPAPGGVGLARGCALAAVDTPFAAWLDADDEWIPGRAARMLAMLERGADVAVEGIDLHDGPSGMRLRTMAVPEYLRGPGAMIRLFERNHLPGDTQVAFRTACFREAGGYDPALHGPESYDLLLRAIRRGARFECGDEVGYRMYAYPGSVSRHMARQRAALALSLRKHDYEEIRRLYREAGYGPRAAAWALVIVAQYREEPMAALRYLDEAAPADGDAAEMLEPDGPWPLPEGWRRAFHRGTILLGLGGHDADAAEELSRAETLGRTAEAANNLGVALARIGRLREARACLMEAARRSPGYHDAALNTSAAVPSHITTHPLRRIASRQD